MCVTRPYECKWSAHLLHAVYRIISHAIQEKKECDKPEVPAEDFEWGSSDDLPDFRFPKRFRQRFSWRLTPACSSSCPLGLPYLQLENVNFRWQKGNLPCTGFLCRKAPGKRQFSVTNISINFLKWSSSGLWWKGIWWATGKKEENGRKSSVLE